MSDFGMRLKKMLKERGMTQRDLASRIFVTDKAVSKYIHDECEPSSGTLMFMAEVLNVSVDELLGVSVKLEIPIKYHADIPKLEKISVGDWIDLRAAEDAYMAFGETRIISLGVSMMLPKGYEAHVLPRSSTAVKFGIEMYNSMGVIDNSYCGTNDVWGFPARAIRAVHIKKGDRIAQFRITKNQPTLIFKEVDELGSDRGGFGSTGAR